MENKIKVLIADDHSLIRQGLKNLLNAQKELEVVGEAIDGKDAIDKTLKLKPDILLLDINMPKTNGIEALRILKEKNKNQKIIMLTIHDTKDYIKKCIDIGANGYLSKDSDMNILKDSIIRVYNGDTYIQPTIIKSIMVKENEITYSDYKKQENIEKHNISDKIDLKKTLTSREYEVIKKLSDGKKNKEIADNLSISEKTVRTHMYNIFKKLKISDRTQAAMMVIEDNYINNRK